MVLCSPHHHLKAPLLESFLQRYNRETDDNESHMQTVEHHTYTVTDPICEIHLPLSMSFHFHFHSCEPLTPGSISLMLLGALKPISNSILILTNNPEYLETVSTMTLSLVCHGNSVLNNMAVGICIYLN